MRAAGASEGGLCGPEELRSRGHQAAGDALHDGEGRYQRQQIVNAASAANAAGGGGQRSTARGLNPLQVQVHPGRGDDVEDVAVALLVHPAAVTQRAQVVDVADDALGEEKSGGQLRIRARRAHGDGHRVASDANLQWLLDGHRVGGHGHEGIRLNATHRSLCHSRLRHGWRRLTPPGPACDAP